MKHDIYYRAAVLLAVMLVAATALGACSDSEPEAVAFELAIADGALDLDPPVLKVKQGDEVTLKVRSDEEGELHLHGYDLDVGVVPGTVAELVFTAHATGKFDFELHPAHGSHDEDSEGCEAEIPSGVPTPRISVRAAAAEEEGKIRVSVEVQDFVLASSAEGADVLAGHWHLYLDGELKSMHVAPEASVEVPSAGEYEVMVRLSGPEHCYYNVDAMTTVVVDKGYAGAVDDEVTSAEPEDEHEEEHEEGEEPVTLGSLEVHPR